MRIVGKVETIEWLNQKGVVDVKGNIIASESNLIVQCSLPDDAGRKTALSRIIAAVFEADDEAMLWIDEFGIWPSSEDWYLFASFRKFLGEESELHEKPGHLFSLHDLKNISSIVAMVLYFSWGAILYSPFRDTVIRISHDDWISIQCKKPLREPKIIEIQNFLANCG